jgi:hypothetical protein
MAFSPRAYNRIVQNRSAHNMRPRYCIAWALVSGVTADSLCSKAPQGYYHINATFCQGCPEGFYTSSEGRYSCDVCKCHSLVHLNLTIPFSRPCWEICASTTIAGMHHVQSRAVSNSPETEFVYLLLARIFQESLRISSNCVRTMQPRFF